MMCLSKSDFVILKTVRAYHYPNGGYVVSKPMRMSRRAYAALPLPKILTTNDYGAIPAILVLRDIFYFNSSQYLLLVLYIVQV